MLERMNSEGINIFVVDKKILMSMCFLNKNSPDGDIDRKDVEDDFSLNQFLTLLLTFPTVSFAKIQIKKS